MSGSGFEEVPLELLEEISKGNVVLFCGAGVSESDGGIPAGRQLAQELARRANLEDLASLSLPMVAQSYATKLGLHSLIAFIASRIDDPRYSPLPTHQLIATLPFTRILTTNWDNLLEQSLHQVGKSYVKVVRDSDVSFVDDRKVLLVKLHGSIEQRDSIVITGDDYYDIFARLPETTNLVRSYFATKTFLFVGFGLADEDFRRMYHDVIRHLGRHARRAYAVQRHPSPLVIDYWRQKNIQVISDDATDFLQALLKRVDSK